MFDIQVDAHVGHALFHNAILDNLKARGKTVILVTHALHFLPAVDRVYTLVRGTATELPLLEDSPKVQDDELNDRDEAKDREALEGVGDQVTLGGEASAPQNEEKRAVCEVGRVAEQGTYDELIRAGGAFAKLVEDFGGRDGKKEEEEEEAEEEDSRPVTAKAEKTSDEKGDGKKGMVRSAGVGKLEGKLIQAEKRTVGTVQWSGEHIFIILARSPSAERFAD